MPHGRSGSSSPNTRCQGLTSNERARPAPTPKTLPRPAPWALAAFLAREAIGLRALALALVNSVSTAASGRCTKPLAR